MVKGNEGLQLTEENLSRKIVRTFTCTYDLI